MFAVFWMRSHSVLEANIHNLLSAVSYFLGTYLLFLWLCHSNGSCSSNTSWTSIVSFSLTIPICCFRYRRNYFWSPSDGALHIISFKSISITYFSRSPFIPLWYSGSALCWPLQTTCVSSKCHWKYYIFFWTPKGKYSIRWNQDWSLTNSISILQLSSFLFNMVWFCLPFVKPWYDF